MESNSVSPMPDMAPMAEFDKTPPTPPEDTLPMDDLPPPPTTVTVQEEKEKEADDYVKSPLEAGEEGIVVNTIAMVLVALGILVSFAVRSPTLRGDAKVCVTERL